MDSDVRFAFYMGLATGFAWGAVAALIVIGLIVS